MFLTDVFEWRHCTVWMGIAACVTVPHSWWCYGVVASVASRRSSDGEACRRPLPPSFCNFYNVLSGFKMPTPSVQWHQQWCWSFHIRPHIARAWMPTLKICRFPATYRQPLWCQSNTPADTATICSNVWLTLAEGVGGRWWGCLWSELHRVPSCVGGLSGLHALRWSHRERLCIFPITPLFSCQPAIWHYKFEHRLQQADTNDQFYNWSPHNSWSESQP